VSDTAFDLSVAASPARAPTIPMLRSLGLSDDERETMQRLQSIMTTQSGPMRQSNAYYDGTQELDNLGIAIPKELQSLRTVVG
jgi:hypothetical protein